MQLQTDDEQDALVLQVIATAEVIGNVLSATAAAMIAEDLAPYPFLVCCAALKKCRQEVKGKLSLSDITARIASIDGRPAKDEAWAIALKSADERDTVIWTAEIQTPYDEARRILQAGDKVGARMAFNSAYERLLVTARETGQAAEWQASVGWDSDLRARAFAEAVKLERIQSWQAVAMLQQCGQGSQAAADLVRLLLPPDADPKLLLAGAPTADGNAIAELLTGPSQRGVLALTHDQKTRAALLTEETLATREASPDVKERLKKLRQDMADHAAQRQREHEQLLQAQRRDLEQRKQRVEELVAQYGVTADPLFQAAQAVKTMAQAAKGQGSRKA